MSHFDEWATMDEVLDLCGVKTRKVGTNEVKVPCPSCGSKDGVQLNLAKGFGRCWHCDKPFNYCSYYAVYYGMSNKDARKEILDRLNRNMDNYVAPKRYEEKEEPIAEIERRDFCYKELQKLGLSESDRKEMRSRGLYDTEIDKLGYISFRSNMDLECVARNILKQGVSLQGVAGFYVNDRNNWSLRKLKKGILVPYRDAEGRVQGFQLRKDNSVRKTLDNGKLEPKCDWLSSKGMNKGTKAKGFVHFATDFVYDFANDHDRPLIPNGVLYLTEGAMKADIAHILSGLPFIAIAGVYNTKEFDALLPYLKETLGVKEICDCLDMDYLTNTNVFHARERIKEMIEKAGIKYSMKTWNTEAKNHKPLKGIDDYLAYHKRKV